MPKPRIISRKPRVDPIRAALVRLAEAQEETQAELRELAHAQRRTSEEVTELVKSVHLLTKTVQSVNGRVGSLDGRMFEQRYRVDPFSFFQRVLRRMRVVPKQDLDTLASDAIDQGRFTDSDREDVLNADLVLYGRPRDASTDAYLVVEVSVTIGPYDVARAIRRAALLARLTGEPALPAVAGERLDPDAAPVALPTWRVLDGIAVPPGAPLPG